MDCLYRNLYHYKYIALLDIDEVIMPLGNTSNWAELMAKVEEVSLGVRNHTRASYNFRYTLFMPEFLKERLEEGNGSDPKLDAIPDHMHMLRHVYRSPHRKAGAGIKCFHNPEKVLTVHNHYPLACIGGGCGKSKSFNVETDLGHLQHYRSDCVSALKKSCEEDFKSVSVFDSTIWRWKDSVIEKTTDALLKLGFLVRQNNTVPNLMT